MKSASPSLPSGSRRRIAAFAAACLIGLALAPGPARADAMVPLDELMARKLAQPAVLVMPDANGG
ncbi:MAG: hypothetical protein ABSG83_20140, partial [Roseiarcus sp.]